MYADERRALRASAGALLCSASDVRRTERRRASTAAPLERWLSEPWLGRCDAGLWPDAPATAATGRPAPSRTEDLA